MLDKRCECRCECGNVSRFTKCADCQISIHYNKTSGKMKPVGFIPVVYPGVGGL